MTNTQRTDRLVPVLMTALLILMVLAAPAFGAVMRTFDNDIGGMEKLTIYGYLEHRDVGGNPGGYLRFDGQNTFGIFTRDAAFTGDYIAQGYDQIACDLTVFLYQMTNFKPQIILRAGPTVPAWYYPLNDFQAVTNTWHHYTAPIDFSWSDDQAMAHGWMRDTGPDFSFADTLHQVKLVGLRIPYAPIAAATLGLDNFYVGKTPVPLSERLRQQTAPMERTVLPRTLPAPIKPR